MGGIFCAKIVIPKRLCYNKSTMGHDEDKNFNALDELNRISGVLNTDNSSSASNIPRDDIILNGKEAKSKKKMIILVTSVLIVLTAVLIILITVLGGNILSKNGTRKSFNRFANYVLYGKDSDEDITDDKYASGDIYYISELQKQSSNGEEYAEKITDYLKNAEEKYDNFYSSYKQTGNNLLDESLDGYKNDLDLYAYTMLYPIVGPNALVELYLGDDADKKIEDYYNNYGSSAVEATRTFGNNYREKTKLFMEVLKTYDKKGCINHKSMRILSSCLNNRDSEYVGLNNAYNDFRKSVSESAVSIHQLPRKIFLTIFEIKKVIYEAEL